MKLSIFSCVIGALLVLIGFFGYVAGNKPEGRAQPDASTTVLQAQVHPGERAEAVINSAPDVSSPRPALSGDQARVEIFEVLAVPNRIERLRRLCELLANVSVENWRETLDGFQRQVLSSGRFNRDESRLIFERIGEVAGKAALEEIRESSTGQDQGNALLLMTGWAGSDPNAAQAWLDMQKPDLRNKLAPAVLNGLARSDPQSAVTFLASHVPDRRDNLVPQMTDEIIQRGGVRESDDLLAAMRARDDIPYEIKGSVFGGAAGRQIELARLRGEPETLLDWADKYIGGTPLMGPIATTDIVRFAAQSDAPRTLDWIEAREGRWTPEQEAAIYPAIALAMEKAAPAELESWMNSHPNHPQLDAMKKEVKRQRAQQAAGGPAGRSR
ncbi:MAG: hypothetical protein ABI680_09015 [Chthoniobacteraceae bacterium]